MLPMLYRYNFTISVAKIQPMAFTCVMVAMYFLRLEDRINSGCSRPADAATDATESYPRTTPAPYMIGKYLVVSITCGTSESLTLNESLLLENKIMLTGNLHVCHDQNRAINHTPVNILDMLNCSRQKLHHWYLLGKNLRAPMKHNFQMSKEQQHSTETYHYWQRHNGLMARCQQPSELLER